MLKLILLFAVTMRVWAQEAGDLSLSGTVVNSKTGDPIRRALVRLDGFAKSPAQKLTGMPRTAFTDSIGGFRFVGLPAGTYTVSGDKPQFTMTNGEDLRKSMVEVELSAPVGNIQVRLAPLGVISGTVTDIFGEPVRRANVIAFSTQVEDGSRKIRRGRTVATDDMGTFRLWNLAPGKYYVKANAQNGGVYYFTGDTVPGLRRSETIVPTYAGGGTTLETATPIAIEEGSDVRTDIRVGFTAGFRIRGTLTNYVPNRDVKLELQSGAEDVTTVRAVVNRESGQFELQDVPAGSYTLQASEEKNTATVSLLVKDDLDGLTMALAEPMEVREVTTFTNSPREAPGGTRVGQRFRGVSGGCNLRLAGATPQEASLPDGNGGIIVKGVRPGSYEVRLDCNNAWARSATAGGQDLLQNPLLNVQPGVPVPTIQITATYGGGSLHGTYEPATVVKTTARSEAPTVSVLLQPQFPGSTGPQLSPLFVYDGLKPQFDFTGLAPGNYLVWVLDGTEIEYRSPEFFRGLTGGTTVRIESDGNVKITIDHLTGTGLPR
jgi:uncharacterized protein (DUF2141 family)